MIRKNIYRWHRVTSLIIALPVLLWAISGFMHPLMTNVRPKVGTQWLPPKTVDSSKLKFLLAGALQNNHIETISNFRIVSIGDDWFYQVKLPHQNTLQYLSTQTGKKLKDGDALYARYLAKQFLTGKKEDEKKLPAAADTAAANTQPLNETEHDCCASAAAFVMSDTTGASISNIEIIEAFNSEYKNINRLLPVYKVSFARADGIRIYVETWQDRFAFAMDNRRAVFDTFFALFHTMSWLNGLGSAKLWIEIILMLLAAATTLMGICIFCITKTKKPSGNSLVRTRNTHRWVSIVVSLFTLMFTLSGAFHAFEKLTPDTRDDYFVQHEYPAADLQPDYPKLFTAAAGKLITGISIVKIDSSNYWQVTLKPTGNKGAGKPQAPEADLMKNKTVPPPSRMYINCSDYVVLPDGEKKYAQELATNFSRHPASAILNTAVVTKFEGEYGFVNKRLPVWKVGYAENNNERWYVETSTGRLAAKVTDKDLWEGYSFAMLHKHHFMDWGGKETRDISTMFWAIAQVCMVTVGLVLWQRSRKKHKNS
ncbi:MAG TPA: PepSY domain-containing protein [Ferruginibacter sp.]|nr:PepSY domain-containing protein [Ferruginibacter sp.]HMP19365.1 PepSY domain-containing protein [Ferruginibacter sp.]